jgi:hypothetical protein
MKTTLVLATGLACVGCTRQPSLVEAIVYEKQMAEVNKEIRRMLETPRTGPTASEAMRNFGLPKADRKNLKPIAVKEY